MLLIKKNLSRIRAPENFNGHIIPEGTQIKEGDLTFECLRTIVTLSGILLGKHMELQAGSALTP